MDDELELQATEAPQEANSATLFVSLYIVLLAFFILLNAISIIDQQRAKDAIASIRNTFSLPEQLITQTPEESTGEKNMMNPVFGKIRSLMEDRINISEDTSFIDGNIMYLDVDADDVFITRDFAFKDGTFIEEFAKIFVPENNQQERIVTVEMMMGIDELPPAAITTDKSLELARSGALARKFISMGVPARNISTGLKIENSDRMYFRFTLDYPMTTGAR